MRSALAAALGWIARTPGRAFLVVFAVAFVLRLGLLAFQLVPDAARAPGTSLEPEAVAASLVSTGRFADPYAVPTGPTAHVPPLHAAGLAAILKVFGATPAAGYARILLVFAAYSAVYALLPWLAGRLGLGRPAGVAAGLVGAVLLGWPEEVEPFAALAMALIVATFHRRWTGEAASGRGSFLLGLASGVAFHLQPVLLAVVAGLVAFELWRGTERRKWRLAALLVLGALVACGPWAWRNYRTFGTVVFVRDNLGLELRMGNHEERTPRWTRTTGSATTATRAPAWPRRSGCARSASAPTCARPARRRWRGSTLTRRGSSV